MAQAPAISQLPNAPTPADTPSTFNRKSFTFVDALARFQEEINSLVTWMNSNVNGAPPSTISTESISVSENNVGGYLRATFSGAKEVSVPSGINVVDGSQWFFFNVTSGNLTFAAADGVAINGNQAIAQYVGVYLKKVGANTYDLISFGSASGGGGGGMTNPMTAVGDLIVGGSSGTPTRLPVLDDGMRLTIVDGQPTWAFPGSVGAVTYAVEPNSGGGDWDGYPLGPTGDTPACYGRGAQAESVDIPPFNGEIDPSLFDGNGVAMGLIENLFGIGSGIGERRFVLAINGSTGSENIRVSGLPFSISTLETTEAEYGMTSYGVNIFHWPLGSEPWITDEWTSFPEGGHLITLTKFS
jgi:hypothetical protein